MPELDSQNTISNKLISKASLKLNVYQNTLYNFNIIKEILKELSHELKAKASGVNKNIIIEYREMSNFEVEIKFGSDVLVFMMHTNVFEFPRDHEIHKTSYVKEDKERSYCGVIFVYNFLADSFKYNRYNDLGYLVARIFINKEQHFFVEGKKQMGLLFNNFINKVIDRESIYKIIETTMLYSIDFDLLTPFYDDVKQVTVEEFTETNRNMAITTGKRLGFRFQVDKDDIKS
ncbi:MAG: hypothetical protein Q8880_00415 [Bacteroidota bacterium]|nr:hypothetical protein [Bacteroidota bacterium]